MASYRCANDYIAVNNRERGIEMTTLKYSEFLKQVIEALKDEYILDNRSVWICNTFPMQYSSEEQKPHAKKLRKTIRAKINNHNRKNPDRKCSTLTYILGYKDEIDSRIKWLENLIRIHESKGN